MNPLIKRRLPKAPAPTKAVRVDLPGEIRMREPLDEIVTKAPTEENIANSQRERAKTLEKELKPVHRLILNMYREGMTSKAIAEKLSYHESSVKKIISKMRKDGLEIPHRNRGPRV